MIRVISCIDRNGVIGHRNKLPWYCESDLQEFKSKTLGTTIIMGRKTKDSIKYPLPDRENLVISRADRNEENHYKYVLDALQNASNKEIWIIGGRELYKYGSIYASELHLSILDIDVNGIIYFPVEYYNYFRIVDKKVEEDVEVRVDSEVLYVTKTNLILKNTKEKVNELSNFLGYKNA